jgi:hypothetical protein
MRPTSSGERHGSRNHVHTDVKSRSQPEANYWLLVADVVISPGAFHVGQAKAFKTGVASPVLRCIRFARFV